MNISHPLFDNADNRLHSVDLLKGVLIIFVIITHITWSDSDRLYFLFPFWIDMAVPGFMIISGFVYTKSLRKRHIICLNEIFTFQYIVKNLIRYTIPFLIVFIIEETVFISLSLVQHNFFETISQFLRGGYGPGSYYFPIMVQFIFVFPFIFVLIQRLRFKGLALCGVINFCYEITKTLCFMNEAIYRLLIFRYLFVVAFGCYLASDFYKRNIPLYIISFIVGFIYIIGCKYIDYTPIFTNYWSGTCFWASLYIIPFVSFFIRSQLKNVRVGRK